MTFFLKELESLRIDWQGSVSSLPRGREKKKSSLLERLMAGKRQFSTILANKNSF